MAADIRRLDGSVVEPARLGRNERVAELLAELTQKNEEGRIAALAVIFLTPEGWYDSAWRWPPKSEGFPWGLAMQGALSLLAADLSHTTIVSSPMPEPEPAPKG